ncbi:hypothetical protein HED60_13920 [Planctomycetales bacterium ZRK34]|nr:hypothetical protein HED60_13920 [Planctomycetales bacterium ZRK34]
MDARVAEFESECRKHLDRFFAVFPDAMMQMRAHKSLRLLRANDKQLQGKAEGWAAGIVYAVYTDGKIPCGIPGILNRDFEALMGVTMGTVRDRAARVMDILDL